MRTTTRIALAATAALAVTFGLTACGQQESQDGGTTAASASAASSAAPQQKVGDTVQLSDLSQRTTAAMKKAGTVKAVMSGGTTGDMTMKIDYRKGMSYSMTGETNGQPLEMRFVDKVLYMKAGSQTSQMAGGKTWLKIDGTGSDPMSKAFAGSMKSMEQAANPLGAYGNVSDVPAKVTAADGRTTTYESTISEAQMREMYKKQMAAAGSTATPSSLPSLGTMTLTQTLDKQDRVTKSTIKNNSTGEMTITYSGWGEPVDVQAPPAAEVGSFDMSSLGGSTSSPTG